MYTCALSYNNTNNNCWNKNAEKILIIFHTTYYYCKVLFLLKNKYVIDNAM